MDSFKMMFNGMKIRVRFMGDDEILHDKCLHAFPTLLGGEVYDLRNSPERYEWHLTRCAGERVGEHPDRVYLEILSPFI